MSEVLIKKTGAITTILLNRAAVHNAVDAPTAKALADAFKDFESDSQAKVAVLGSIGDSFCAGADLKAISQAEDSRALQRQLKEHGDGPMGPTRMMLSKPVIAAIQGYAVAGGLELALWCDLRVVEESAKLGVFCRKWGVPLIDGGTVRLPRLIGLSRALDLILTGREVDSVEAFQIGLANRIVPDGTALKHAETLANEIAAFPQLCLKNDRMSAYDQFSMDLPEAILQEFRYGVKTISSGESLAGARRFEEEESSKF